VTTAEAPREGYPLTWPIGVPRTKYRKDSPFKLDLGRSLAELADELRRLGTRNAVISCSIPRRLDGFPLSRAAEPDDPGVAVYFDRYVTTAAKQELRSFVIACDAYRKVAANLRAVAATIEALRTIERHGSSTMLEQAFAGFAALPPATSTKPWWDVLGLPAGATREQITAAHLELLKLHHPDRGGDTARMAQINAARDEALRQLG
jgi:hypothetical protein